MNKEICPLWICIYINRKLGILLHTNEILTWIWGKVPFSRMSDLPRKVLLLWFSRSRSVFLYVGAKGHFWPFRYF